MQLQNTVESVFTPHIAEMLQLSLPNIVQENAKHICVKLYIYTRNHTDVSNRTAQVIDT